MGGDPGPGSRAHAFPTPTLRPGRRREDAAAAAATVTRTSARPAPGCKRGQHRQSRRGNPAAPGLLGREERVWGGQSRSGARTEESGARKDCRSQRRDPGRAGLGTSHQLGPSPPSCPSPPPEPDFTPPPARARRNSHFAAADRAPTTAAATVTSRRRAAGPAPPQRPGRRTSS